MLTLLAAFALTSNKPVTSAGNYYSWALDALRTIRRDYYMPDRGLYSEVARGDQPAFDWGVGVLIPAFNLAAHLNDEYKRVDQSFLDHVQEYWNPAGPVPGYDVLPMPKPKDRYYDDNEWMVMGLAEAADVFQSSEYLKRAEDAFEFVKSGWDDKLGGGVYWRESDKASKNTCSNGPATADALALYRATKEKPYLDFAKADYAWTKKNLRDPADGLYWDSISLDGKIGRAKFSYNSALMLRSAADLYAATGDDHYADDARALQDASLQHWIAEDGSFKDDAKFGFLLTEAWFRAFREVPGVTNPTATVQKALTIVHDRCKDFYGNYGNRWDQPLSRDSKPKLIDTAATVRAFLVLYLAVTGN